MALNAAPAQAEGKANNRQPSPLSRVVQPRRHDAPTEIADQLRGITTGSRGLLAATQGFPAKGGAMKQARKRGMRYKVDRWFEGRRLNRASGATNAAEHDKRPGAKARGGRMALGCRARPRQFASVAYVIRKVVPPSRARSHSPGSCSRCATTPSKRSRPHALDPLRRVPPAEGGRDLLVEARSAGRSERGLR